MPNTFRAPLLTLALTLSALLLSCGSSNDGGGGSSSFDAGGDTTSQSSTGHHQGDATTAHDSGGLKLTQKDSGGGGLCTKKTCAELKASCGQQGDGCGGLLECGSCTAPATCGGGGVANQCGTGHADAGDSGSTIPMGTLSIAPLNAAITVAYGQKTPTLTYTAQVGGQSVAASFSIDLGQVAAVDASSGVLTPSGLIGGVAHVTATFGTKTVSTPVTVTVALSENGAPGVSDAGADATSPDAGSDGGPAGGNGGVGGSPAGGSVSPATQMTLQGTTMTDATLQWLYPYDKTVWPQGLLPPLLQWTTALTYDAVSIQLKENAFIYQGYFSAPVAGQPFINVPISQTAWDTLAYSNQGENVSVTLTFSAGGVAYGPLTETWIFAQGTLTGTVYYNSYGTSLAINFPNTTAGLPPFGGATLAIKHGATSPVLVAGTNGTSSDCRVCHSVAAGGSQLITEHGDDYQQSSAYALATDTETVMPPLPEGSATVGTYAFPAIYPDGTFLLANGGPLPGVTPPATSGLYSIPSGTAIASSGLPANFLAATPAFSPDGTHVAYNAYSVDQASLAVMSFDVTTNTFSNPVTLNTPAPTDAGVATTDVFPSFLPTNDAVIFEHVIQNDGEFGATRNQTLAELWWADLATQTAVPLAVLNGAGYLPVYGTNHANDAQLQYEPTVNPVVSGGYAWVVFTSRRLYGNVATQDPFLSDPRDYNASESVTTKKLWVAAIDLNAPPGTDPSHPAFYLPAQELHACNSRGYWVVDPCEQNGTSCLTGDQCCSGYCGQSDGGFVCGVQPPGCAVVGNKCAMTSDCCGASSGISCIGGYCSAPARPQDAAACMPTTCAKLGQSCGPAGDGCGGILQCGTCTLPYTCGGGGVSGVCGGQSGPP
jgi:hypothetical protein